MSTQWIKASKGIRYREHATRKHGKRADRYYTLVYKLDGKTISEGVGWWSDGVKQEDCEKILMTLRTNQKSGIGAKTYKEMREENIEKHEQIKEQREQEKSLTIRGIFENGYLALQRANNKNVKSIQYELNVLNKYLDPFFKNTPLKKIDVRKMDNFKAYLNNIVSERTNKPLSDSSKRYIITIISQIFNYAISRIDSTLQNPVRLISKPRSDNKRERFLTVDEASRLLAALKEKSINTHDIALLSLFCGLKAGEILALTWIDINFDGKTIFIRDPKNKESRHAHMTAEIETMLKNRFNGQALNERIFTNTEISHTFERTVQELGLNEGRDDRRDRIVFHTLRHTFASWHAQRGTPLYTISTLLGHKSLSMTQRYSHLCPNTEKLASMALQGILG